MTASAVRAAFPHVVVIGPLPPPTHGASRITELLVDEARSAGLAVTQVSTTVVGQWYHVRRVLRYLTGILTMLRMRMARRPAVVYIAGAGGPSLAYQLVVLVIARFCGMRRVFHHHSYAYLNRRSRLFSLLVRAGGPDTIHVGLCQDMAGRLRREYGCRRVETVSNAALLRRLSGPDSRGESCQHKEGATDEVLTLGHLSNLSADKGILVVLQVVSELRSTGEAVRLRIAGPAADNAIRMAIRSHIDASGGADEWLGQVTNDQVPDFMRSLDCFLMPSKYVNEAQPLVVLEALREGTPAVTSGAGCLREMLGAAGWVAEPEAGAVAAAVRRVAASPGARITARGIYAAQADATDRSRLIEVIAG